MTTKQFQLHRSHRKEGRKEAAVVQQNKFICDILFKLNEFY